MNRGMHRLLGASVVAECLAIIALATVTALALLLRGEELRDRALEHGGIHPESPADLFEALAGFGLHVDENARGDLVEVSRGAAGATATY